MLDSGEMNDTDNPEDQVQISDSDPSPFVKRSKVIGIPDSQGEGILVLSSPPLDLDPNIPELKRRAKPKPTEYTWKRHKSRTKKSRRSRRQRAQPQLPKRKSKPVTYLTADKLGTLANKVSTVSGHKSQQKRSLKCHQGYSKGTLC